ncbi:hypothetical protein chiPu_0026494 [Chiloscyllium punctatum]|uniref:Uncharacterized protein n=1 Tax=Chiloscyllium punctatum TaxID=137246 RepID=A0A401TJL6_CHIPU|nr:hypothetical protein [Chiloscyllium punctatum]
MTRAPHKDGDPALHRPLRPAPAVGSLRSLWRASRRPTRPPGSVDGDRPGNGPILRVSGLKVFGVVCSTALRHAGRLGARGG